MTFPLYAMSPRIPSLHCQGLLIHQAHRHFHQSEDSRGCREKIKTGVWRWQTSHAPRRFRDQCQLILCLSSHCLLGQLYATSPSPDESPLSPKHHVYGLCHSNFRSDSLLTAWSSEAHISVSQSGFSCYHILYLSKYRVILPSLTITYSWNQECHKLHKLHKNNRPKKK